MEVYSWAGFCTDDEIVLYNKASKLKKYISLTKKPTWNTFTDEA